MAVAAKRKVYVAPKVYTYRQLEELWILAGGPKTEAPTAAAIALAESGGHANAEGHNTNGTIDRGLWQINSVHGALSTTNVAANVKAAVQIHKESGWSPWTTFKTGAYTKAVTTAQLRSGVSLEKPLEPQAGLLGILQGKVPGFSPESKAEASAEKTVEEGVHLFSWESLLKFSTTAILLLAGAVLVVYGIMVAIRPRESAFSLPRMMPVPV